MRKPILVLALALTLTWPAIAERAKIPKTAVKLVTAKAVTKPEKAPETIGRPANELFGAATDACAACRSCNWFLCERLPLRSRVAPNQRSRLASDAAIAQPQLGPSSVT